MALPKTQGELDEFVAIQAGKPGVILEEEIRQAQEYLMSTPAKPPQASLRERLAVTEPSEQLSPNAEIDSNHDDHEGRNSTNMTAAEATQGTPATYVQDTLRIHGSAGGFPAEITVLMGSDDWEDPDFFVGLTARLENIGFGKPIAPAVAAPARAASNGGGGGGGNSGGGASAGGQQQGCGVHGFDNARKGYQGRGMECGAYSDTQESWTRDKPYTPANGSPRWYCASKW